MSRSSFIYKLQSYKFNENDEDENIWEVDKDYGIFSEDNYDYYIDEFKKSGLINVKHLNNPAQKVSYTLLLKDLINDFKEKVGDYETWYNLDTGKLFVIIPLEWIEGLEGLKEIINDDE